MIDGMGRIVGTLCLTTLLGIVARWLVLLVLSLGPLGCAGRELDDGTEDEPIEHSPELLEQYTLACQRCYGERIAEAGACSFD